MTTAQLTGAAQLAAAIEEIQRSLDPLRQVVEALGRQAEQIRWLSVPTDEETERG